MISVFDAAHPRRRVQEAAARGSPPACSTTRPPASSLETGGRTLVPRAGTRRARFPGPGDAYNLRLTKQPTAPVTLAILTDGQTDVTIGGRIVLAPSAG